jgi:hypothetical protein
MVVFVAAGFSLRRTGETPVPPRKVGRKIFDWSQLGINVRSHTEFDHLILIVRHK